MVQLLWRILHKFQKEFPHDPVILLLDIYPQRIEIKICKRYLQPHIDCSRIDNGTEVEATFNVHCWLNG